MMYLLSESCALGAFLFCCSVYDCVCLFVQKMLSYLCVCVCVCMHMCMQVLVGFIPKEDSFPQQALSGCFWAHSVHSWRQLLSPAYLTSLLASTLFFFPQFFITYLYGCQKANALFILTQYSDSFQGSFLFYETSKLKENWSFIVGIKIILKRLQSQTIAAGVLKSYFYSIIQHKSSLKQEFSKAIMLQWPTECLKRDGSA